MPKKVGGVELDVPDIVAQCFTKGGEIKLPKVLATCADALYEATQARYKLQHQAKALEELETQLEEYLKAELPKRKETGVSGSMARIQLNPSSKAIVGNWDKFYAYVKKHNAFDLLQRRLNEGAYKERADNKEWVPGITQMEYTKVSCTAIKR